MLVLANEITRDAEHRYWLGAKRLAGVTEILSEFGFLPDFDAPFIRARAEYKADLGTKIHKAAHLYFTKNLDVFQLDPAIEPYFASLLKFEAETGLEILHTETLVYDPLRLYAGQLDLVARLNGALWLLDLKTGGIDTGHKYQTAAYAQCLPAELQPAKRGALKLHNDGTRAVIVPFQSPRDYSVFNALALAYYAKIEDKKLTWETTPTCQGENNELERAG